MIQAGAPGPAAGLEPQAGRIAVYSCYFGTYEPLNAAATGNGAGYDRFVLTDHPLALPGIRVLQGSDLGLQLGPEQGGAVALSRLAKIRPHLFFSRYDWVIYIDNSASLLREPARIVAAIEAAQGGTAPAGRYLFPHQRRTCAYREARLCKQKGRISREDYHRQVNHYLAAGFPKEQGLYSNTVMVQKMGDPETDALNDAWYDHFLTFSPRDQISLPFMLWQRAYPVRLMPMGLADLAQWPVFKPFRRAKFQGAQRARAAKRAARLADEEQAPT